MKRNFWLGFFAYLAPTFPLGYVWHLVVFADQYHALNLYREEVIIPMGLASMLVQAVLFSWCYPKCFDTAPSKWISSGLQFSALFGVLAWSFTTLPVAAKYQMTSITDFILLESAFTLVQFAVIGPLLALAHRK